MFDIQSCSFSIKTKKTFATVIKMTNPNHHHDSDFHCVNFMIYCITCSKFKQEQ